MDCKDVKECVCPNTACEGHKRCCVCVARHREKESFPFCLFPDPDKLKDSCGDNVANYFTNLRKVFKKYTR